MTVNLHGLVILNFKTDVTGLKRVEKYVLRLRLTELRPAGRNDSNVHRNAQFPV